METAIEKHQKYIQGDFNLSEAVENYLENIAEAADDNAFVDVYHSLAREQAAAIDQKRAAGAALGKLAGTIIAIKDNICIKDQKTTCGSKILDNFVSPYSATVIQKILAEDGLIIGKTNMDEFAMGSSTETSIFGPARNPVSADYVAGGSSGGSAVAVAKGLADLALGSDTGGSIRQPAAFCGIAGLKPTYGRVSRYGLVAYASSLDQIGPFGRSVADTALLLNVIAGEDPNDSTSVPLPAADYLSDLSQDASGIRIGIPENLFSDGLDADIQQSLRDLLARLAAQGFSVKSVKQPLNEYAVAVYYIIATAEASSNLARYDGVRYGYRSPDPEDLQDMYLSTRSDGFGEEVKRRIMLGTYVLSAGYYDAYYKKAQQVRRLLKEEYEQIFREVDVLLTPTTPAPAFKLAEKLNDPLQMYLSDIYTVTVNLAGICGISIPGGTTQTGMPVGIQLTANAFQEATLFKMGTYLETLLQ